MKLYGERHLNRNILLYGTLHDRSDGLQSEKDNTRSWYLGQQGAVEHRRGGEDIRQGGKDGDDEGGRGQRLQHREQDSRADRQGAELEGEQDSGGRCRGMEDHIKRDPLRVLCKAGQDIQDSDEQDERERAERAAEAEL